MHFVIVVPVLFVVIAALVLRNFGMALLSGAISFVICMAISTADIPRNENTAVRDTTEIREVQIGEESIYVATGTEDGQRKYTYWTENGQKTVHSRVKIFDSEKTEVVTTNYEKEDTFFFLYGEIAPDVEIYVPKGAIKYNYNIQAR